MEKNCEGNQKMRDDLFCSLDYFWGFLGHPEGCLPSMFFGWENTLVWVPSLSLAVRSRVNSNMNATWPLTGLSPSASTPDSILPRCLHGQFQQLLSTSAPSSFSWPLPCVEWSILSLGRSWALTCPSILSICPVGLHNHEPPPGRLFFSFCDGENDLYVNTVPCLVISQSSLLFNCRRLSVVITFVNENLTWQ